MNSACHTVSTATNNPTMALLPTSDPIVVDSTTPTLISQLAARLPRDFVLGAGTSAFQIEGASHADGKTPSIWDEWCKAKERKKAGVTGDKACEHYRLCKTVDCELMRSLGLKTYRFSIAGTRVIKAHEIIDGANGVSVLVTINPEGVAFYRGLMEQLNTCGIEPMPTLYHWDLPQSLQDAVGGWLSPVTAKAFAAYARVCFEHLGHLARRWTTLNKPYVVAHHGHGVGGSPPGVCGREFLSAHHLLLAHALAVKEFHDHGLANGKPDECGTIGIVLNCAWREPADPSSEDDHAAAAMCLDRRFGWFAEPLRTGQYPKCMRDLLAHAAADGGVLAFSADEAALVANSVDFVGLNYYTTKRVKAAPDTCDRFVEVPLAADSGVAVNALGWAVEPTGLGHLLARASAAFPGLDLWVTENGYADSERTTGPGVAAAVDDGPRIAYIAAHLQQVADAIAAGANVRGYVVWTRWTSKKRRARRDLRLRRPTPSPSTASCSSATAGRRPTSGWTTWSARCFRPRARGICRSSIPGSLLDNLEWNFGYGPRFGIVHVDFASPERTRTLKKSALWYQRFIEAHTAYHAAVARSDD